MSPIRPATKMFAIVGLLVVLFGAAAGVFFLGGYYSVAAGAQDPKIVNFALVQVRRASIARHATGQPPAFLFPADAASVQAGARAFSQRGCVNCHGGPGVGPAAFSDGLNPPPNLKKVVGGMPPQQIFWVIENGIKMTGMPSFASSKPPLSDQEAWTIVAFLKKLPDVSSTDFKAWTAGSAQ